MTKARTLSSLASAGALDYIGTVKSLVAGTGLTGGTITTTGTISLANTTVTAGSYTAANITIDAQGRITSATSGTAVAAATATARGTLYGTEDVFAYSNSIGYGSAPASYSVAIGYSSISSGANFSVSAGYNSSVDSGSGYSIALGSNAKVRSGTNSVVIGAGSNIASGGSSGNMVLLGAGVVAGYGSYNSIVIGQNARLGNYAPNAIILEATGSSTTYGSGFYVNPITQANTSYTLFYNPTTKKVTYDSAPGGSSLYVYDDSNLLTTAASTINFVGNGVTATSSGGSVTVEVAGGSNLDGLSDVVLTSPTTGQLLQYNGTNWVNATVSTGGTTEETTITTATRLAPMYVNQFNSSYVRIGTDSPAKATHIKDAIVAAASVASSGGQQVIVEIIYNNTIFSLALDSNASSYVTIFNSDAVNIQNYQVNSFSQNDSRPAGIYVTLSPSQYNQIAAKTLSFTFLGSASTLGTVFTTNKPYGVYYTPSNFGQPVGSLGPTTSPSTTPEIINVVATGQTLDVVFANNVVTITGVSGTSSQFITFVLGMTSITSGGGGGATESVVTVETPSNFNGQFTAQPNTTGSRGYVFVNNWDGGLNSLSSNSPTNWGVVQGSTQWLYSQAANPTTGVSISWDPIWYGSFTAVKIQGVDGGGVNSPNRHVIYQQTIYGYNNGIYWPPQQNWAQNYQMYSGGVAAYAVVLAANNSPLASWMQSVTVNSTYTNMVDITIGTTGPISAVGNTDFKYMVLRIKPEAFNSGNLGNAPLFTFSGPPSDIPLNWVIAGIQ